MKKIFALMVALMMALSCTATFAEEMPATPVACELSVSVDRDMVGMLLGMVDESMTELAPTLLDILENASVVVTVDGTAGSADICLGETKLCDVKAAMAADGSLVLVSSLIPSYALSISAEDLAMLMEQMQDTISYSINDAPASLEDMEALLEAVMPYIDDVMTWAQTKISTDAQISEDGNSMVIYMTSHDAAQLGALVLDRLSQDEVLLPLIAQSAAQEGISQEELLAELVQAVNDTLAAEPEVLGVISAANGEDGSLTEEIVTEYAYLLLEVYENAGLSCVDVSLLLSNEGTDDWAGVSEGLANGTNTTDMGLGISFSMDDSGMNMMASLSVIADGSNIALYVTNTVDMETGVDALQLAVDIGMGSPIVALQALIGAGEAVEMPSLEGLTVLDPMAMGEEETNALMEDLMSYGLMSVLGAAQQAMPDQIATVMQLLGGAEE